MHLTEWEDEEKIVDLKLNYYNIFWITAEIFWKVASSSTE